MNCKVLIVDDEPDICDALLIVCKRAGFSAFAANSASTGLQQFETVQPDVLLTDVIMPDDGLSLISEVRKRSPNTRIIAMSGGGERGPEAYKPNAISTSAFLISAQKAGADATLTKPFDTQTIIKAITNSVE